MANEMVTIRAKRDPEHKITVDKVSADFLVHRGDWEAIPEKGDDNGSGNTGRRSGSRRSGNSA